MTEPELLAAINEAERSGDRALAFQLAAQLIALWAEENRKG